MWINSFGFSFFVYLNVPPIEYMILIINLLRAQLTQHTNTLNALEEGLLLELQSWGTRTITTISLFRYCSSDKQTKMRSFRKQLSARRSNRELVLHFPFINVRLVFWGENIHWTETCAKINNSVELKNWNWYYMEIVLFGRC